MREPSNPTAGLLCAIFVVGLLCVTGFEVLSTAGQECYQPSLPGTDLAVHQGLWPGASPCLNSGLILGDGAEALISLVLTTIMIVGTVAILDLVAGLGIEGLVVTLWPAVTRWLVIHLRAVSRRETIEAIKPCPPLWEPARPVEKIVLSAIYRRGPPADHCARYGLA